MLRKKTYDFGVKFVKSKELKFIGFSDSDWGGWVMLMTLLGILYTH